MHWASACVFNAHHVLVLRRFTMLTVQAGDDDYVGNEGSDTEPQLIRRGRKLPVREQLIVRESIYNAEWRKTVILLQEVDVCLLAVAREQAVQCWALESAKRR